MNVVVLRVWYFIYFIYRTFTYSWFLVCCVLFLINLLVGCWVMFIVFQISHGIYFSVHLNKISVFIAAIKFPFLVLGIFDYPKWIWMKYEFKVALIFHCLMRSIWKNFKLILTRANSTERKWISFRFLCDCL